jgi:flavin reductase (DIM6/NTAB) family NADH-FMN oxidoreductase RutF
MDAGSTYKVSPPDLRLMMIKKTDEVVHDFSHRQSSLSVKKIVLIGKTPRPIAFISTIGPDGEKNVCPPRFITRVLIV